MMAAVDAGGANPQHHIDSHHDEKERYTFFFGSDSPFSNWHPASFTVKGIEFNCTEQYMMYQKAVLFKDEDMAKKILASNDPRQHKAMGRKVKDFDAQLWNEKCKDIVKEGNIAKFSQNEHLKVDLFSTAGTILVEANPRDTIWGIGLGASNKKALTKATWRGKNWLGYILTDVREKLMAEETGSS